MLYFALLCLLGTDFASAICVRRSFGLEDGLDKFVCVCNRTYCDELETLTNIPKGNAAFYETSKAGSRFESTTLPFYDEIEPGLAYNMGRIPIASTDFSTRLYSYDDVTDDYDLEHFALAKEDFEYKIPLLHKACAIAKDDVFFIAAPWRSPKWLKNYTSSGLKCLKGEPGDKNYQTWADYFVRFLQEYEKNNVTVWAITPLNEPILACMMSYDPMYTLCSTPEDQRDFIKLNLGPTLEKAGFGPDKLKLFIVDDWKFMLKQQTEIILNHKESAKYVFGIAFHWYLESVSPYTILDDLHREYPDMMLLSTEASIGAYFWETPKVDPGSWERGERYATDIIQVLLNWATGWIDWNLALDMKGGPTWLHNFVDSAILINATNEEFYKSPMYYAIAHFSKFLQRGSRRIGLNVPENAQYDKLYIAAFQTPQDSKVLIIVNRYKFDIKFALHDAEKGYLNITANGHSIQTYQW